MKPFDDLPLSQFITPRGYTYHYIHTKPSQSQHTSPSYEPPILILHGFPSIPYDFHHQIHHLASIGHSVIAPYLLGYHPTSTPKDPDAYRLKLICDDIIALLNHHSLDQPINVIGHDWGATLLSRLEYYYPDRVSKLAYLTIGPTPFGGPFDLAKVNEMTKQALGYEGYGYQKFFMDDLEGAAELLSARHERMEMLMFAANTSARPSAELWKEYFGRIGGLENWLRGDEQVEMLEGVSTDLLDVRRQTFVADVQNDSTHNDLDYGPSYAGPLMWYVGLNTNINMQDERDAHSDWETYKTSRPVLLVPSKQDPIAIPDMQASMTSACLSDPEQQLNVKVLEAGHFGILERPNELNARLQEFFEKA